MADEPHSTTPRRPLAPTLARWTGHLHPFPLPGLLKGYNGDKAKGDLRAGLNVALLAFPQGIAYAAIAGLPIQYGVYGSVIAAILGPILSGSRFIMLGPTNATSAMLLATFGSVGLLAPTEKAAVLPLVLLMTGLLLMLGAFFKVANLIQYVSRSVVAGYITAAAIYIIANQLKKVLGLELDLGSGANIVMVLWATGRQLLETQPATLLLSGLTAGAYFGLQRLWPKLPNVAITLIVLSALTVGLEQVGLIDWLDGASNPGISKTTAINATEWAPTPPPLDFQLVSDFALVSLIIAFLCVLEGISIGKTLAARSGQQLDANQEMLGIGVANLGCALGQGMPASGSLTRSQLNFDSGGRTPLSSIFSGLIVLAGALLVGPLTRFIPVGVLGVLVIVIGYSLINRQILRVVWHTTGSDRAVFLCTFVTALLVRLDVAIVFGTVVSILLFLRKAAQPELLEYTSTAEGDLLPQTDQAAQPEVAIVHVEGNLFFGAAELFRDQLRRVIQRPNLKIVVLKLRNAHHLDATSVLALDELVRSMQAEERHLLISEAREETLAILRNSGLDQSLGAENIFADDTQNPTLSTSKALKRAMQLLQGQVADVKIYLGASAQQNP